MDKFKIINDTYGHHTGDEVLKSVSKTLKSSIRKNDKLIRYGEESSLYLVFMRERSSLQLEKIVTYIEISRKLQKRENTHLVF